MSTQPRRTTGTVGAVGTVAALACWAFATWLLLTWTLQPEQLIAGAVLALGAGVALAPLGPAAGPWRLLPRGAAVVRLVASAAVRIVRANVELAVRIWRPSLPLRSGMVVVPTTASTPAERAATGLITSLIVDNQIVDLDEERMQFHAVWVPDGDRAEQINLPVERLVRAVAGR